MTEHDKDLQAEELADLARRLEAALEVEAPDARREKALFVAGAGARRRTAPWLGAFAPAAAAVGLLVVLALVSRTALPGDTLFPVREVLGNVGLAPSTAREIREHLDRADRLAVEAATTAGTAPGAGGKIVHQAWAAFTAAEELIDELEGDRRAAFEDDLDALEERIEAAEEAAEEALEDREREAEDEGDSSGSGSGSDDDSSRRGSGGGGDSSGSGSGGDDDSSGSGSGSDDSGGGDSSGSGSGDDDSSGSGSGDDDDSSGSGSDDSGGGDSSGSGSGDD